LSDVPDSVRIVDLGSKRTLASLPALIRYLRRERPAVVFSTLFRASVVSLWASRISRIRTRLVVRHPNMLGFGVCGGLTFKERAIERLFLHACRHADVNVVSSTAMAERLNRLAGLQPHRVTVIPNPVPLNHIMERAKEPLNHPWFQDGEPPVILGVGRLTTSKNFGALITALAKIRRQRDARVMILGEGPMRGVLESRATDLGLRDHVALPGFDQNPYNYMRRCAIFVLPSRVEGFPNALVEAMACGVPVVATACPGGTSEILENGRWGSLVPVDDPDALADALVGALANVAHPDVSARAREFSVDTVVSRYANVFGVAA
jgi:glycosyltransferase involved in cell wall biosynthesis